MTDRDYVRVIERERDEAHYSMVEMRIARDEARRERDEAREAAGSHAWASALGLNPNATDQEIAKAVLQLKDEIESTRDALQSALAERDLHLAASVLAARERDEAQRQLAESQCD